VTEYHTYLRLGILLTCSLRLVGLTRVEHQLLDGALEQVCRKSVYSLPRLRWVREFLHFGENSVRVVCYELQDVLSAACFAEVGCFDGNSYNYFAPTISAELAAKLLQHCDTTYEDALTLGSALKQELAAQTEIREEFARADTRPYDEVTRPGRSLPSRLRDLPSQVSVGFLPHAPAARPAS
jgi:hypothetical protein